MNTSWASRPTQPAGSSSTSFANTLLGARDDVVLPKVSDEVDDAADLELRCEVDGEVMQLTRTSDLLFTPADIVAYISQFTTLEPGDLIATGTPGGVGAARAPKVFLQPGQVVRVTVEGVGECVNTCVEEKA